VIDDLNTVFKHEAATRQQGLTAAARLAHHQAHSGPIMEKLKVWLEDQVHERRVEPNSSLGKAFQYLLNHWHTLTQFLRVPGAPIDNNTVEVRFVDPKPNQKQVWGMGPELRKGNELWLENLILV
jgi:hypothetical protein